MKKEYMAFVQDVKGVTEGQEIQIVIKDLTPGRSKYDSRNVKAIVSSSPDRLPEGDVLHIRSETGFPFPQPWAIKITQELELPLPGIPFGDISAPEK